MTARGCRPALSNKQILERLKTRQSGNYTVPMFASVPFLNVHVKRKFAIFLTSSHVNRVFPTHRKCHEMTHLSSLEPPLHLSIRKVVLPAMKFQKPRIVLVIVPVNRVGLLSKGENFLSTPAFKSDFNRRRRVLSVAGRIVCEHSETRPNAIGCHPLIAVIRQSFAECPPK